MHMLDHAMFKSLAQKYRHHHRERARNCQDSVLGKMRLADGGWWEANAMIDSKRIGFGIGGETTPSNILLAHAHDIVRTFPDFENMISVFLAKERRRMNMTPYLIK